MGGDAQAPAPDAAGDAAAVQPYPLAFYRVVTHRLFEALIIGAILLKSASWR